MVERKERIEIIVNRAIEKYGENAQVDIMIEEMSELTQALIKLRRIEQLDSQNSTLKDAIYNVREEIADVWVMLQQMMFIFESDEIFQIVDFKIKRTEERLL